jgi:16S rRNA U1498 N3-methylase RsmE
MADEGVSEDEAQALASVVRRQTDHDVEVLPADGCLVVEVRRARPGDSFTLRDAQDWQWLKPRICESE